MEMTLLWSALTPCHPVTPSRLHAIVDPGAAVFVQRVRSLRKESPMGKLVVLNNVALDSVLRAPGPP